MPPKSLNRALTEIPRSGIRRIADRLTEVPGGLNTVIHLGLGEPQEPAPAEVRSAVARAAAEGLTKYTPNAGLTNLREAIRDKLRRVNGAEVEVEDIFITPGGTYAVAVSIGATVNPGDEVLVPDPGYPNFAAAVRHYGGVPVYYPLREEEGFRLRPEALVPLVTERSRMLIVNSPSNPTGAVLPWATVERLVRFTEEHGLWLLSDEVYEAFTFGVPHVSALSFPHSDHVIGVFSFSKTYGMTGLRVGYLVTRSAELNRSLLKAQELYISCAPSTSQAAALAALGCGRYVEALRESFRRKRDLVLRALGERVHYVPEGAFYLLVDISDTGLSSDAFADALLMDKKVAVAPGSTFGPSSDRLVRIALTAPEDLLAEGTARIKAFIEERRAAAAPA